MMRTLTLFPHGRRVSFFSTRQRKVYAYGDYPTPAKGPVGLLPMQATQVAWIIRYQKNIGYHAVWRAHLFFLLLIVYQDKHRVIQMGRTRLQHGRGIGPHLQACHSSFFPGIVDVEHDGDKLAKSALFEGSFFYHWNNMTVCCPNIVNRVDQFFEGNHSLSVYRHELLKVLHAASAGLCDPVTGLHHFFCVMQKAFEQSQTFVDKQTCSDNKLAAQRVLSVQHKGLLNTVSVNYDPINGYFDCLLGRKPYEPLNDAYKRTQIKLLTGDRDQAKMFLNEIHKVKPDLVHYR